MPNSLLLLLGRATAAVLHRIGRFLCQADAGERVEIWSIGRQDARVFFPLLLLAWGLGLAALAGAHYASSPPAPLLEITPSRLREPDANTFTLLDEFSKIVIGLTALTLMATPILANSGRMLMSIAGIINEKFIEPRINRIREGFRDEVIAEVRAAVRDEVRAEVQAEMTDEARAEMRVAVLDEMRAEANARWIALRSRNAPEPEGTVNQGDPPPYNEE